MKQVHNLVYFYTLRHEFPNCSCKLIPNGYFTVSTHIQASPQSEDHLVQFKCAKRSISVYVFGLGLSHDNLQKIPHIFTSDSNILEDKASICLYYNRGEKKEFVFGDPLNKTIIPWTQEWLYFYDLYKITGHWYVGGKSHEN